MTPGDERVENRKARIMQAAALIYSSVRAHEVGISAREAVIGAIELEVWLNQEVKSGNDAR